MFVVVTSMLNGLFRKKAKSAPESIVAESVAIIGAGLTGVTLSTALRQSGYAVTLIEKSRGIGGRISERREGSLRFLHGALYPPGRDSLKSELGDTTVIFQTTVTRLLRKNGRWSLESSEGSRLPQFDWVLVTSPAPQAATLLAPERQDWSNLLSDVRYEPAFTVLIESKRSLGELTRSWGQLASVEAIESQTSPHAFTLTLKSLFISTSLNDGLTRENILDVLKNQNPSPSLDRVLGDQLWKYATCAKPVAHGQLSLVDHNLRLGVAGDAFGLLGFDTCRASAFDLAASIKSKASAHPSTSTVQD